MAILCVQCSTVPNACTVSAFVDVVGMPLLFDAAVEVIVVVKWKKNKKKKKETTEFCALVSEFFFGIYMRQKQTHHTQSHKHTHRARYALDSFHWLLLSYLFIPYTATAICVVGVHTQVIPHCAVVCSCVLVCLYYHIPHIVFCLLFD